MKKNHTKTNGFMLSMIFIVIIVFFLLSAVSRCKSDTEQFNLDEMRVYHSDKGLVELNDGYINIKMQ